MPEPKIVHILGGGQWQVPTIRLAKDLGYRVLVTDMYHERPGYAYADEHVVADITNKETTLAIAERNHIDAIICDTTDVGVPTMAYVAEKLGLPGIGYETALNFTNKYRMRSITSAAALPNPRFHLAYDAQTLRSAAADLGFPLVVKPVDSQSSRGVHIVRMPDMLTDAYEDAVQFSLLKQAIVEEFLAGTEVTVESYCIDGECFVAGISDKDHFAHRPEVASRLTYPADFPEHVLTRIRDVNSRVVRALGLITGIAHAEYMVVNSEVYLVEIAARGAGSYVYTLIAPYLAGVPIPRLYLEFILGIPQHARPDGVRRAANLGFFSVPPGKVTKILGVEEARRLPGVAEILLEFAVGDELQLPQDDRSRPGLVVVFGKTRSEVLECTQQVFRTVQVKTSDR